MARSRCWEEKVPGRGHGLILILIIMIILITILTTSPAGSIARSARLGRPRVTTSRQLLSPVATNAEHSGGGEEKTQAARLMARGMQLREQRFKNMKARASKTSAEQPVMRFASCIVQICREIEK